MSLNLTFGTSDYSEVQVPQQKKHVCLSKEWMSSLRKSVTSAPEIYLPQTSPVSFTLHFKYPSLMPSNTRRGRQKWRLN